LRCYPAQNCRDCDTTERLHAKALQITEHEDDKSEKKHITLERGERFKGAPQGKSTTF